MKCKSCKTKIKEKTADFCPFCGSSLTGKNYTDINIILDRSGSMEACKDATMKGFNGFLLEQAQVEGNANISLYQFDNEYEMVYENKSIKEAKGLDNKNYQPRGSTALLDAVGKTIIDKKNYYNTLSKSKRPNQVLFVVLTDGEENASQEFSKTQVKKMIEKHRGRKWQFAFIGAGIDAFSEKSAGGIGYASGAIMSIQNNNLGMITGYKCLNASTVKYRSTGGQFLFHQTSEDTQDEE